MQSFKNFCKISLQVDITLFWIPFQYRYRTIEGQYLPTEKGDVLLCKSTAGKLRWAATSDPLPTNGIYPGMKCETLGVAIPGATGKNVECTLINGKNVWIYKN